MNNDAWYKNPWVWLILFFPFLAVAAGIATVIITSQNQPEMVVDDYYKKGKGINLELSLYNKAEQLGVQLALRSTAERVEIKSKHKVPALKLSMVHSTLAGLDFSLVLTPNATGTLSGSLDQAITGKWQAIVMPMDESWKVRHQVVFPSADWQPLTK